MKKLITVLFSMVLLGGLSTAALAVESQTDGEVAILLGHKSTGWVNYQFNQNLDAKLIYDDDLVHGGVHYQFSDRFGIQAGMVYNTDATGNESESNPYAGINWMLPLGENTKVIGKYDYDYQGEDWQTYEAAIRIEMFPAQYIHVGVRGDTGPGFVPYSYQKNEKEPMFFIRGDFGWKWNKVSLNLRPLLYVKGYLLHDYDLKYQLNEKTSLVMNINSLYDKQLKYRAGVQFKF